VAPAAETPHYGNTVLRVRTTSPKRQRSCRAPSVRPAAGSPPSTSRGETSPFSWGLCLYPTNPKLYIKEALNSVTINTEQAHRQSCSNKRKDLQSMFMVRQELVYCRGAGGAWRQRNSHFHAERRKDRHSEVVRGERKKKQQQQI